MKTIPISKPGAGPAPTPDPSVSKAAAAKERAIAILTGNQGQTPAQANSQVPIPVNANNISVEDFSAVQQKHSLQNNSQVEDQSDVQEQGEVTPEQVREASKPAESKVETETQLSNSQLAIIQRKERAFRARVQQQEQALKTKEASWAQEKAALEKRLQELETGYIPKSSLKQAAMEAFNSGELSYDEVTQDLMNPQDPRVTAKMSRLEKQVNDLQLKLDNAAKGAQEQSDVQYKAALKQIETDVRHLVKADPSFEMIKLTGSERDVVELIEETYKQDGYVMTSEEAAQQVEDYLVEEASKLARADKIKKRLAPVAPPVKKEEAQQSSNTQTPNRPQQPQQMKTLTNTNTGSRKLSSRERAILAFKGDLKS